MVKFVSADGRAFTSYYPSCQVNKDIQQQHGITNSYDYRMFLQRNATTLMNQDREFALKKNNLTCNCPSCAKMSIIK